MKKMLIALLVITGILIMGIPALAAANDDAIKIGINGGLGVGYYTPALVLGADLTYQLTEARALQISPLYVNMDTKKSYDYISEKQPDNVTIFGVLANFLFNYNPSEPMNRYFIVGTGFVSKQDNVKFTDGSGTDNISMSGIAANFGIGCNFTKNLNARAELPICVLSNDNSSEVVLTFLAVAGYNF
jgi:hypothetical protein